MNVVVDLRSWGTVGGGVGPSQSAGSMPPRLLTGSSKPIICAAWPLSILSRSKAKAPWPAQSQTKSPKGGKRSKQTNWLTAR
jgi:hypothetical protein